MSALETRPSLDRLTIHGILPLILMECLCLLLPGTRCEYLAERSVHSACSADPWAAGNLGKGFSPMDQSQLDVLDRDVRANPEKYKAAGKWLDAFTRIGA